MPGAFDNPYWGGGGFTPVDPLGQPTQGFGGALASRGNSLIGMGMGLLQPYRPWAGESPWTNALQGWQAGSASDIATARTQQQMRQQELERQDRLAQQAQAQKNWERSFGLQEQQFKRGGETEAERAARLVLPPDATDEQRREFYKTYLLPKTEGELKEGKITYREQEYPYLRDRLGNYTWPLGRPPGGPGSLPGATTSSGGSTVVPGTTLYWPGQQTAASPDTTGAGGAVSQPTVAEPPKPPGYDTWLPSQQKAWDQQVIKNQADIASGKMTEEQSRSSTFAARMENAEKTMSNVESQGTSAMGRGLEYVPGVGNYLQSPDYQKYTVARSQFITALLRRESGAAISPAEFDRYDREFFPRPGDSAEVIRQKREARKVAVDQMKKSAGPGYRSPETSGGAPVRVQTPDEARRLPSGTPIILPDGTTGRVP